MALWLAGVHKRAENGTYNAICWPGEQLLVRFRDWRRGEGAALKREMGEQMPVAENHIHMFFFCRIAFILCTIRFKLS